MVRLQKALGGSLIPLDLGSAQTARHPVDFWLGNHPPGRPGPAAQWSGPFLL